MNELILIWMACCVLAWPVGTLLDGIWLYYKD